jgi:glutamine synthetase
VCKQQGQYYCSVGTENAFGRQIADYHLRMCIIAGVKISGINAEVAPGQWEFQIGPCEGIEQGDHMWIARYLLERVGELFHVSINFEPKPMKGQLNGSGCHTNFSTHNMRNGTSNRTGLEYIDEAIKKLSIKHSEHMEVYGSGNEERMTGEFETAKYDVFSDGIANRGCSIRRGNETYKNQKGYFEDRRPSSNCDPYLVTSKIFDTITG